MSLPRGDEPLLAGIELRRRAGTGAATLTARGAFILLLGVGANIALARLLVPHDFGVLALGTVVVVVGGQLAHQGLGASLIRRDSEPTRPELEAVSAVQLAATTALALLAAAAALPLGRDGLLVATMAASLPIAILRTPSVIVLERRLRYREISIADVVEAIAFYSWSLTTVALGMGVWGVATGMVVRALSGTVTMLRIGPLAPLRPRWSWPLVRPLIGFGLKFQAVALAGVARDQGVNVAVAAIAGVATLGIWNLAWRILQVPLLLFGTAARIAYPAVSRLLIADEDPRTVLERATATLTVATGLVLAAVAGFAPAVPSLTGTQWSDVSAVVLWSSVALASGSPIAVVSMGYLMAAGEPGLALRATVASAAAWLAVTLPLLAGLGAAAVGIGWIAGAAVAAFLMGRATRTRTQARLARSSAPAAAVALVAIGAGWLSARAAGGSISAGLAGVAAGEVVLLGGLALFRRRLLRETYALFGLALAGRRDASGPAPAR